MSRTTPPFSASRLVYIHPVLLIVLNEAMAVFLRSSCIFNRSPIFYIAIIPFPTLPPSIVLRKAFVKDFTMTSNFPGANPQTSSSVSAPATTPKPEAVLSAIFENTPTSFILPVKAPAGTEYGRDRIATTWVGTSSTVGTTPVAANFILEVFRDEIISDASGNHTMSEASVSATDSSSAGTNGAAASGGTTSGTSSAASTSSKDGVEAAASVLTIRTFAPKSKPVAIATGTQGALFPGNTFVYTTNNNTSMESHLATSKGGLSDRAAAGIAIGCLIAGALIAALASFLLFSRGKKRNAAQAGHYEPTVHADEHDLKHPAKVTSAPMRAIGAAAIIENNLPQPKEDNTISGDLSRIKSRIEGHVDSYYHTAGANSQTIAQALSAALGTGFPVSMVKLQELLSDPRKRLAVFRAAIAWIIVSRIDFSSGPDTTFLPRHVADVIRDLSASRMDEPSEFSEFRMKDVRLSPTALVAFLSKWRQITAALSGNAFTQELPKDDSRMANIARALSLADTFLRPCAKDVDHEKRLVNLEAIMKRAARFGFLLFSQPSSFQFDWTDNDSGLVVFPGLLQVSDENGRPVASPRAFGSKEVIPL